MVTISPGFVKDEDDDDDYVEEGGDEEEEGKFSKLLKLCLKLILCKCGLCSLTASVGVWAVSEGT